MGATRLLGHGLLAALTAAACCEIALAQHHTTPSGRAAQSKQPGQSGQSGPAQHGEDQPAAPPDALADLNTPGPTDGPDRAAARVLAGLDQPAVRDAIAHWITREDGVAIARLAAAADGEHDRTVRLARALLDALRDGGDGGWRTRAVGRSAAPPVTAALGASLLPDAAACLVAWLDDPLPAAADADQPTPQRPSRSEASASALAHAALVAMTGRDDLPADHAAWHAWLERRRYLPEARWYQALARDQADRARALAQRHAGALERMALMGRRLHAALPEGERRALVVELLGDGHAPLRRLGAELVSRALERGEMPQEDTVAAILSLLDDPQPELRQVGAVLVDRVAPPGSGARLADALRREHDPQAAAVMLRAFGREPNAIAADAVVRWLSHGPATRPAAARACLAMLDAGVDLGAQRTARALDALRTVPSHELASPALSLLLRLGDAADAHRVTTLLAHDQPAARLAAARALAAHPAFAPALLQAAASDPALLAHAADALLAAPRPPDAQALARVARIESAAGASGEHTARVAARAALDQRLLAAERLADDPAAVLALLAGPGAEADQPAPPAQTARAALLVADAHTALGAHASALEALEAPAAIDADLAERLLAARVRSLCLLGRLDRAQALGGDDPLPWLEALEALATPNAPTKDTDAPTADAPTQPAADHDLASRIAARIESLFAGRLSDQHRERLAALRQHLQPPPPAAGQPDPQAAQDGGQPQTPEPG